MAWDSMLAGFKNYKIIPEMHYFAEMALQGELINPRFCHTYTGESLVGRIVAIYAAAANGPFHATIQGTVLRRFLAGLQVAWSNSFN